MNELVKFTRSYLLKNFYIMDYSPRIRHNSIVDRKASSFLYIMQGKYLYQGKDVDFVAKSGEVVYLPQGSSYTYFVLSEETYCMQLTFDLFDAQTGEPILFTSEPKVKSSKSFSDYFVSLFESYSEQNEFAVLGSFYKLLAKFLSKIETNDEITEIEPALIYIKKHFKEKIYIEDLAKLCGVSPSHFRRLFVKCLGVSPIYYKRELIVQAACNLILNEQMSVGKVARSLNFDDIYAFSHFFKKQTGMSPTEYAKKNIKITSAL